MARRRARSSAPHCRQQATTGVRTASGGTSDLGKGNGMGYGPCSSEGVGEHAAVGGILGDRGANVLLFSTSELNNLHSLWDKSMRAHDLRA